MIKQENRKSVKITLHRTELLYDIKNYAYIEGDLIQEGTEPARHYVLDITEQGNIDRVSRVLNLAYAATVEALYPYSKVACDDVDERDDILTEPTEYVYTLSVPEQFSKTTVTLLARLLHEFLVCRVLTDWFSITKPESSVNWGNKMDEAYSQIMERLNARMGRIRRTQTPF